MKQISSNVPRYSLRTSLPNAANLLRSRHFCAIFETVDFILLSVSFSGGAELPRRRGLVLG